jgi:hypothetical protein
MKKGANADDILSSLNDYIERQKKRIEDENERLLREGHKTFERMVAERRETGQRHDLEAAGSRNPAWPQHLVDVAMSKAGRLKDRSTVMTKELLTLVVRRGAALVSAVRLLLTRRS